MFKNLGFASVFKIDEDPRARSLTYAYVFKHSPLFYLCEAILSIIRKSFT